MNRLPFATLLSALFALAGCSPPTRWDEVVRATSPDGRLDAVLAESNGGATTTFVYHVHVVAAGAAVHGDPVAELVGATRNRQAYGASLAWTSPRRLEIRYLDAYTTRRDAAGVTAVGAGFDLAFAPGRTDPGAPPGGMRHNIERAKADAR